MATTPTQPATEHARTDGSVVEKDRIASVAKPNTIGGGLVELLVGIIGGLLGMPIGGTARVLIGSLFDIDDAETAPTRLSPRSRTPFGSDTPRCWRWSRSRARR